MIGGCCGTTPEHVRWMAKSGRMLGEHSILVGRSGAARQAEVVTLREPVPLAQRSDFAAKVAAGKFVVSVEVNPAPGLDPSRALDGARMLLDHGVDIVNVADAPRAVARMSNLAFCSLLLERHRIQPILHVCGRDRNLLGQMAHLLGAHAIGIRNLGHHHRRSRPRSATTPEATAVYDLDAIGLLQMAANMNRGSDPAGKPMPGGQTSFLLATGSSPARRSRQGDQRLERRRRRRRACDDRSRSSRPRCSSRCCGGSSTLALPVMVGVLPLVSYKNAEFLHNEGARHADPRGDSRAHAPDARGRGARREGVQIAREMLFAGPRSRAGRLPHAAARTLRARARSPRRPQAVASSSSRGLTREPGSRSAA
jgi:homocysteine S-methyltransferase